MSLTNLQALLEAKKAAAKALPEVLPEVLPVKAEAEAEALTGKALTGREAVLAKLRALKAAKTEAARPSLAEGASPSAAKPLLVKEALAVSEALPHELLTEPVSEEELSNFLKEHSETEVIDIETGKSMGFFSYELLCAKAMQFRKLANIKSFEIKARSFEAAKIHLEAMAESYAARQQQQQQQPSADEPLAKPAELAAPEPATSETFSLNIELNAEQQAARDLAMAGKSFCLIGPAGTGKTTAQRATAKALWEQGNLREIDFSSKDGEAKIAPSFAACAFTRRAASNLRKAIFKDEELAKVFEHNILTIHALLEYEPVYFFDDVQQKETMRFQPRRSANNKLELTHLVIEEASMVGAYDLWAALYEALPDEIQIIFIGDINQLPPVFGPSILNYALIQLPIVELTKVYRQAGDSGILANAHRILKGEMVQPARDVHMIQGRNKEHVGQEKTAAALNLMFQKWYKDGLYDPEEDIILCPYNEQALGTIAMNLWISQFLGQQRQAAVYEIIAGFNKLYLAVGDKVMCDKRDGIITNIAMNTDYMGKHPQAAGKDLSRFGVRIAGMATEGFSIDDEDHVAGYAAFDLETLMTQDDKERKRKASHTVTVMLENGQVIDLNTAGDFGPQSFQLGYCLTGHKAQGCEWRKVFIIMHPGHHTMIFREWLYTAWTRAREELYVIAKDWLLQKAIENPRVVGDTIEEKVAYFNSKLGQLQDGVLSYKP
jgi:DNA replication protein DnaC